MNNYFIIHNSYFIISIMDVTCLNCGTTNRNTSRFCAKCGEELPRPQDNTQQSEDSLNLPWLQGVHERAVKQTGGLNPNVLAEAEARMAAQAQAKKQETLQTPQAEGAAPETPASPETPPQARGKGAPDEPPPDWVVGILEPGAKPQISPEQSHEPEELDHIMPWLSGPPEPGIEAPQGTQETQHTEDNGKPGLPPWLSGMTVQETLQSSGTGAERDVPNDPANLGIEELQPFVPPDAPEQVVTEPIDIRQASKRKRVGSTPETVPDWLKPLAPRIGKDEQEAPPLPPPPSTEPSTRFGLEPTGSLLAPIERNVPIRPPRPGSVETLAALLHAPTGEVLQRPVSALEQTSSQGALRRVGLRGWLLPDGLIYLVILAALVAVLLIRPPFGEQNAPAAGDVIDFYNAIELVPADRPVLVVYDWDATRSAEMSALADAVTRHLMARRLHFMTVSTVPQGPGFAQAITDAAKDDYGYQYGRDYLVLGYLPGNEAALSSLLNDFSSALPFDYVNGHRLQTYSLVQSSRIASLRDFALIITLASDETTLRNWIEQVSARTGTQIVAAVPQALEPLARPYRNVPGAGLKAVVSGQAGALRYIQQMTQRGQDVTGHFSTSKLADRLNAQSIAQILVALVILAAFVNMGMRRILRR